MDGATAQSIVDQFGVEEFLGVLRESLRDRSFRPVPARERMIPKPGGKVRRLGISTITDRVVQASLKLVLEPIFRGGFSSMFLWVPSRTPGSWRGRRGVVPDIEATELRVDRGG